MENNKNNVGGEVNYAELAERLLDDAGGSIRFACCLSMGSRDLDDGRREFPIMKPWYLP